MLFNKHWSVYRKGTLNIYQSEGARICAPEPSVIQCPLIFQKFTRQNLPSSFQYRRAGILVQGRWKFWTVSATGPLRMVVNLFWTSKMSSQHFGSKLCASIQVSRWYWLKMWSEHTSTLSNLQVYCHVAQSETFSQWCSSLLRSCYEQPLHIQSVCSNNQLPSSGFSSEW